MSQRGIIYQESDKRCEYCGKYDECRPYGKNNEQICYACGQKDVKTTKAKMDKYLFGGG
jgi:hypothetical protein